MADGNNITNNDIPALMDSQLEASLDAMWFDTSFAASPREETNTGMARVNNNNNGTNETPIAPLHMGESISLPNPFSSETSNSKLPAEIRGAIPMNSLVNESGVVKSNPTSTNSAVASSPKQNLAQPLFSGRPQLFGKEIPFSLPFSPPDPIESQQNSGPNTTAGKRKRAPTPSSSYAISEDESERERRRQGRNYREQQRSQQISNQIVVLRNLLEDAKVDCKPDKFSTLASVVDYVKALQQRSAMLDSEHKKLLNTIRQTTEIMSSQYMSVQASPVIGANENNDAVVTGDSPETDDDEVFVQGIDYQSIFRASPFALATTSIDGRFLDCSEGFEKLTKFSREELLPTEKDIKSEASVDDSSSTTSDISSGVGSSGGEDGRSSTKNLSLFNVLNQGDMGSVYHAMYDILQQPSNHLVEERDSDETDLDSEPRADRWSNDVHLSRDKEAQVSSLKVWHSVSVELNFPQMYAMYLQVKLYLHLVRTLQQRPRFFNCTLVAGETSKVKAAPITA